MAKIYGNLVGAQVQALNSGLIGIVPRHCKDSYDLIVSRDYALVNGNVIGDQISMGVFKSTAFIDTMLSWLLSSGLGAGAVVNVGDVTYPSGLVAGASVSGAGWGQLMAFNAGPASQIAALLWQKLGYPADPGGNIELLATFAAVNPQNGSLGWRLVGRY